MLRRVIAKFACGPREVFLCKQNNAACFIPSLNFSNTSNVAHSALEKTPFTMKVKSTLFRDLFTPEINTLKDIFKKYQYEIRIAGGAVRDLLLDKKPHDIDFATNATPTMMKEMFQAEGIRMINNRGESHGTITARINDAANYEITTLRIDVLTDGRHAEVEFTENWQLDAERRDLTVNSMFLGLDGTLYDYFNGYNDLMQRRVAFVGSADKRIKEDYLRILRYFRFYGRIAANGHSHNSKTLDIIKENVHSLTAISGERIWSELQKIMMGNHVYELMETMVDVGMPPYIGMPKEANIEEFKNLYAQSKHLDLHPMTMLTALIKTAEQMIDFQKRLKFPNFERDLGLFLIKHRNSKNEDLQFYKALIVRTPGKVSDIKKFTCELLKYCCSENNLESLRDWSPPKFPLSGHRLIEKGVKSGTGFKFIMAELKDLWITSDFVLTEDQLLEHLPQILQDVKMNNTSKKK